MWARGCLLGTDQERPSHSSNHPLALLPSISLSLSLSTLPASPSGTVPVTFDAVDRNLEAIRAKLRRVEVRWTAELMNEM